MEIERKIFGSAGFKVLDATQGLAEMIVSVFNNVDSDDEIVAPGFFAESIATRRTADNRPKAKGVWSHDWSSPIAKTLDAQELMPGDPRLPADIANLGGLYVKGQFNLETQRGREAFSDLQFGTVDEFSIGYSVKNYEYDTESGICKLLKGEWYEWSPVLVGANPLTSLMGTKSWKDRHQSDLKGVSPKPVSTETAPEDTAWSAPSLKDFTDKSWSDLTADEKRNIAGHYAWAAQMPPDTFGDLKLPYCEPKSGKVVWNGVKAAGAALMGSRGGVDIPDADVPKVKARLAPFYKAFDKTPPWEDDGKSHSLNDEKGQTLDEEITTVLAAVASVTARVQGVKELRLKEGRALSQSRRDQMAQMRDAASEMAGHMDDHAKTARDLANSIDAMLEETAPKDPEKTQDTAQTAALLADFLRISARLNGVHV